MYLGPGAAGLRGRVAGVDGVSVVTGGYDLYVDVNGRGAFTVRHGSGDLLGSGLDAEETVRRVEWQALVHELLGESFPGQDFNVVLDILDVVVPVFAAMLGGAGVVGMVFGLYHVVHGLHQLHKLRVADAEEDV